MTITDKLKEIKEKADIVAASEINCFTGKQVHTLIECLEYAHAVLENISHRPSLPNPDKDADWKNFMKWSSAEAKEAIEEIESKLGEI